MLKKPNLFWAPTVSIASKIFFLSNVNARQDSGMYMSELKIHFKNLSINRLGFTVTFVFSFCYMFEKVSTSSLSEVVQFRLLETVFGKVSLLLLVIGQ